MALLRTAWGRGDGRRGPLIGGAWLLVAVALATGGVLGGEVGFAQAAAIFTGVALAYMAILFMRAPAAVGVQQRKAPGPRASVAPDSASMRRIASFVLLMVAGLVVATLLSGLSFILALRAGVAPADAIVGATVLSPLLWASLACWSLMDTNAVRRVVVMVVLAALGAAAFVLGMA